ncbi:MAG: DNA polymerase III subunit alpha [Pseudobdellovibrionaceae bacterium]
MATLIKYKARPKGFVELLGRSNFSFLQSASHPEEMVEQSIRLGYDGLALCDLNGLYGIARGYRAAKSPSHFTADLQAKENYKYLIGSEVTLTDETSLVLLPMNKSGYQKLCELLTLGKRQAQKGFSKLSIDDVLKNTDDLVCLALPPWTRDRYQLLWKHFGDRLYLPVWRDFTWESNEFFAEALKLEDEFQAQLFVTNRPFMHTPERKSLFDVLTCTLHHTSLYQAKDILIQNSERYLRPLKQLYELWKDRPDLVDKTVEISARLNFSLKEIRYRYPQSGIPAAMSAKEYLRQRTAQGLQWRYGHIIPEKVRAMVQHELQIINELEYEDYFLTLDEICQFAREHQILYQGRGSAANSVVCFALGLTSVDPTKIDLLFERFISRERGEPPDIDIDFEHSRREEVIQYIYRKYNEQHAAMVCTVIRFRSRMALREVAKVFEVPLKTVNAIIKFMGRDGMRRLKETPDIHLKFAIPEDTWKLIIALSGELHGFPRHLGIHTGGFLISHQPISEIVPVEKATMSGRFVIQWNKDDVNDLGLMKIDVLSLGMLTALRKCFDLLRQHKKLNYNLATLPSEDLKTYDMICKADTVGVFQIESRAQMNTLPRLKPRCFYDLVIEVALVRPGPLQGGMVHPFLRRRQGLEKVIYPHPDLEPVLRKTMGVPIFQEQVMKIAIVAAGFTPGEADELRRVMSDAWRKKTTMEGIRQRILSGLEKNGVSPFFAEQVYKTIQGFANYGFPESHAASFALLSYASSYIKCHHPDVFVCALLNSQPMGFYAPRSLVQDARAHGVTLFPLCIQKSDYDYTLEGVATNTDSLVPVRIGLRSIYGVPERILRQIESERKINGIYLSLEDFVRRTQTPKAVLMKLASSGAFSVLENNVRDLLWKIESINMDQNSFLWGQPQENIAIEDEIPEESAWDEMTREYETKGFSLEHHPLSVLRPSLEKKNAELIERKYVPYVVSQKLSELPHRQKVRIAGLIAVTQRPPTAKGFCFITLEDEHGCMNIVIPPDVYQKDRLVIYGKSLLEIHGEIEKSGPLLNVRAHRCFSLL